ncbi:MAG: hypothetical protein HC849_23120 [Oscillatoriales cyanobacterium RU_3_3]|nr:hypothetical protein [Microcoleus sp. SM1_3_4]NJM62430.1 hypothetical protein [Oscillatoriales cyanobacterium RU_3_3]
MKNFTISLYAFHLRHTLTDAPDEVDPAAQLLWENLAKLGATTLPFSALKNLHSKLICYQNNYEPQHEQGRPTEWLTDYGSIDLGSFPTTTGIKIQGNLQPFRLHDTYAVDLTLSPESPQISIDITQLQLFKPASLLPASIQASIGQTIWIYAEVDPSEDCQQLAEKLATAFLAGTPSNPVLNHQDKLFGSFLFEYQTVDPNNSQNPAEQCQIMVSLNNTQADTIAKTTQAYDWLLRLLSYYHKIHYIYRLSRESYARSRAIYSKLDRQMRDFPTQIADPKTRLKNLNKLLTKLPLYAINYQSNLGDIKAHHTAINTNIKNYETCLKKIQAIGDCPQFWQEFLDRTCDRWQNQIQIELDYLSPGQELFGQMVETIRGVVETEQAEIDRRLERTIQIVGTGLAAGGIVVSSNPYSLIEKKLTFQLTGNLNTVHPFIFSILISLCAALLAGFLTWLLTLSNPNSR